MFYIIETRYVGPNQDQRRYLDADKIEISTVPAVTSFSQEICTRGWCGTTDGWAVHARGEYYTLHQAHFAIRELFGEVCPVESDNEHVVETYRPRRRERPKSQTTENWIYEAIQSDITADITDERISELLEEYDAKLSESDYRLNKIWVGKLVKKYRQQFCKQ